MTARVGPVGAPRPGRWARWTAALAPTAKGILKFLVWGLPLALGGGLVGVWLTSHLANEQARVEFQRDERIAAYSAYIGALLTLEEKMEASMALLLSADGETVQRPVDQVAAQALADAMNESVQLVRREKSIIDIVGTVSQGSTEELPIGTLPTALCAINSYGEVKGAFEDALLDSQPWPEDSGGPLTTDDFDELLDRVRGGARQPFTRFGQYDLGFVPDLPDPVPCPTVLAS